MSCEQSSAETEEAGVDSTRDRILRITLRLLEEHGYSAVTTESIAADARVSKATIYRHWTSRQHVVVEATRLRFGPVEVHDLGSFQKEIKWILEHRLADYREPGTLRLVGSLIGAATNDDELRAVFDDWIEQFSEAIRHATERGVARGDVRDDVDTSALEVLAAGVIARTVITQKSFSPAEVDELATLITRAAARFVS
jgi:AcrR family transcriptional regulator